MANQRLVRGGVLLAGGALALTMTAACQGQVTGSGSVAGTAAPAAPFVPIIEPDTGHPAQPRTSVFSGDCRTLSTADMVLCFNTKIENTDAQIDAAQQARYAGASLSEQATINAQDAAWLKARGPVCTVAFHNGGSIDEGNINACVLDESTARLDGVKGTNPPEAMLKSTDAAGDTAVLSWYTTPGGSRIAEASTQGDQTGGAIIEWTIIGGADGFLVNLSQFHFSDGSFTDHGVVQPPDPTHHKVGTGEEYQFSIDYSHLSADPTGGAQGGFVYAPGNPVASWH